MKIREGYKILNIGGNNVLCDLNDKPLENEIVISKIGLFLWDMFKNGEVTNNDMLNCLLQNFEISTVLALSEIDKFVRIMKENGIIE